jgi:hypothetical protein
MFQQIETEGEAMNELPPFLFNTMNTKLGLHVGIKEKIPHTENDRLAYLASIYSWQEFNGPLILACDEDFYMWLHNFGAEMFYVDIIPLNLEYKTEEDVLEHFKKHTPYELFFVGLHDRAIMDGEGKVIDLRECYEQKDFVDLQLHLLPDEYQKITWQ